MGLYDRYILPPILDLGCSIPSMMREREKTLAHAEGVVLEVGAGSGLNLKYYPQTAVTHIHALDPAVEMLNRYRKSAKTSPIPLTFHEAGAEDIPLDANSIDTLVLTFALCTIPSPLLALQEMRRVLKSKGRLLFCEHGLSQKPTVQQWQHRLDAPWGYLVGGCHLNRDIPGLLREGGFDITALESHTLSLLPQFVGTLYRGMAIA